MELGNYTYNLLQKHYSFLAIQ